MTKQSRLLLILSICIVILAVITAFLLQPKNATKNDNTMQKSVFVTDVKVNEVNGLALKNQKGNIGIINENGVLQVLDADTNAYDTDKLAALLYNFAHLTADKVVENPLALREYGLEEPEAQISLLLADGRKQRIFLGKKCPVSDHYYLQKEGDGHVYLIPALSAMMMLQAADDLRILNLYPPLDAQAMQILNKITLETSNGKFTLTKLKGQAGNLYEMSAPVKATLDWKKVDTHVIIPLQQLVPQQFVSLDIPLHEYGLDQPDYRLELELDGKKIACGFVQKDADTWYCANLATTLVSSISTEQAAFLQTSYLTLLGDSVYTRTLTEISRMSVTANGKSTSFTVNGEATELTLHTNYRVLDYVEAIDFYNKISAIPAAAVLTGKEKTDPKPLLTLTVALRNGEVDIIEFLPISERQCAVSINGQANFATYDTVVKDLEIAFATLAA